MLARRGSEVLLGSIILIGLTIMSSGGTFNENGQAAANNGLQENSEDKVWAPFCNVSC